MAIPRGLRDSLLKYQKRRTRPLSQGVPRYAGQCDFARPVTRVPGGGAPISGGFVPTPDVYMGDLPTDYIPNVGFMDIPEPDYGPYDTPFVQMPLPVRQGSGGLPQSFEPREVDYNDCLMSQEFFDHQMQLASRFDNLSLDQVVELGANQDFIEKTLDIERLAGRLLPEPGINPSDSHLPTAEPSTGQIDYSAADPHDFFEQQTQMIEKQFSQLDQSAQMEAVFAAQDALFELSQMVALPPEIGMLEPSMSGMGPAVMLGPGSLDDIVEAHEPMQGAIAPGYGPEMPAYGDSLMTQELFEQQMHEAAGEMGPPEAAGPYDTGMDQQDMYDQPMPQDMMEPEMMDPDMMPGPMGPNFMPEPPPGP